MIVVDSSIWIGLLRGQTTPAMRRFQQIARDADDRILLGDLILLEVLQGARDEAHAARIERNLRRFPVLAMLDDVIAVQAARNYRILRSRGITVRKTIDMVIGTFCLSAGHSLLHDDRDFDALVLHLGLRAVTP
ncbi:MAG: PIN domain nuclease [Acetobacteraceae bacterium]